VTGVLFLLQPLARLSGRLQLGLTPWRSVSPQRLVAPWPRTLTIWSETWRSAGEWLVAIEGAVRSVPGVAVGRGGEFNRWDIEARGGPAGTARLRLGVEDHGDGKQLVRLRVWPKPSTGALVVIALLGLAVAFEAEGIAAKAILGVSALLIAVRVIRDCAAALAVLLRACAVEPASSGGDEIGEVLMLRARAVEQSPRRLTATSLAVGVRDSED
jgi:hypothetical protein